MSADTGNGISAFVVRHTDGRLAITMIAQDTSVPMQDVHLVGDTLSLAFNEPEADVLLTCALIRQPDAGYAGRCADAEGKWAHVTMTPPGS